MGMNATLHAKDTSVLNPQGDPTWQPLKSNAGALTVAPVGTTQAVPDFQTPLDFLTAYGGFSGVAPGDIVTRKNTSNGQSIMALIGSVLDVGTDSTIVLDKSITQPGALEIEASMVRARHKFATMTLYADDVTGPDAVPDPINITTIYQSNADFGVAYSAVAGTILTIVLETALPADGQNGAVFLSDWVHVDGLVDNRLNYPNLAIKYISPDRKTITCGFSDESALPSIAATYTPALGSCKLYLYNNMKGAHDGAGFRFTGTTATSAALVSIFAGGDVQVSGTLVGDHRVTVATTDKTVTAGATFGNAEIKASSRYRIEVRPNDVAFLDKPVDANLPWTLRAVRSAVKPAHQKPLFPRFRLIAAPSATRPVAKIISISKSGSTTWTVNHDGAYTFVTGQYVTLKGVRDITNFPNITTPTIITVVSPTQFTLVSGTGTATSYGGSVILANGGVDQPGIIGQNIQSATLDATTGWLTLVGNTTWAGLTVGDYVELHGCRIDLTGADLGIDGCWEVANVTTTSLVLMPVFNIGAVRVSPAPAAFALTNCGGTVILRTTLRAHDMILESYNEARVTVDGAGTSRIDKALPVRILANDAGGTGQTVTLTSTTIAGTTAVDAAIPNPVAVGGRASNANITAMSATGDLVAQLMTMIGAAVNKPFSLPEADWQYTATIVNNTSTPMQAAGGAGIKKYLTGFTYQNTNATATVVNILRGTTVIFTFSAAASMTVPETITFHTPLQTAANEALNVQCVTTGANLLVNAQGYTAP